MGLRVLTRHIKIDLLAEKRDICELLFTMKRAQRAWRLFLEFLKENGGCTRSEMNRFAWDLQAGKIDSSFKYSRRRFYGMIRRTLMTLGLIAIESRFVESSGPGLAPERSRKKDVVDKYVPVRQPIQKRPPDGLNLVRLTWVICKRWNDEFLGVRIRGDVDG